MRSLVDRAVGDISDISVLEIPEITEWISCDEARLFPYNKSWDEGKSDPWLIFHTSGTTGTVPYHIIIEAHGKLTGYFKVYQNPLYIPTL